MFPPSWYGKIDELPEGRSGTPFSITGGRTYTRQFMVTVTGDGKLMGPIGVCSHPLLPRPWSFYVSNTEYDTLALLSDYKAEQRYKDDWQQWVVTATYSTFTDGNQFAGPGGAAPGDLPTNPSNAYNNPEYEYPKIEFNYDEQQKPALMDLDKKPYQNSAMQPFTPPMTFPRAYRVLNITRNEIGFNPAVADSYAYSVNDATFLDMPPGFVQCMPPRAEQLFKGNIRYYRVTYTLKFHPRGIWLPAITGYIGDIPVIEDQDHELNWQPVLQDQGYMRLQDKVDSNGKPFSNFGQPIPIERNGRAITQQILLDGGGQPATVVDPSTGMLIPFYIKRRQFPAKNFTSLVTRGVT